MFNISKNLQQTFKNLVYTKTINKIHKSLQKSAEI